MQFYSTCHFSELWTMHQIQQKSKEKENVREVKDFFQNLENSMSRSFILAFTAVLKRPAVVAYT